MTTRRSPTAAAPIADAGEPAADDMAARVLRQFRQVFNSVKTHFQQVERRAGLGGAQVWALSTIKERPGVGVGELARAMDIHQSTASNLVKGLVERDLVEARREGADRRSVQLRLRPAGAAALRKAPRPFTGVLPDALRRLDAPSLNRLHRDLGRLISEIGADEGAGQVPLAYDAAPRRAPAPPRSRQA
jgi:DNA-binding MarR family transcriptional regulator